MIRDLKQLAFASEWALAKFFPAIFEDGISDIYRLISVCGREDCKDSALERLVKEIGYRHQALSTGQDWRFGNTLAEMRSATYLIENLKKNKIDYSQILNGRIKIPDGEYDAAIFSTNPTHIDYFESLIMNNHHVLCEKPLVVVTNEFHQADRSNLDRLKKVINEIELRQLVAMDAEHYSAKIATLALYERIGEMIMNYGRISRIEAETLEKDDPNKPRTKNLLCRKNRTGLLLDMGVHLFGIISNIEGIIPDPILRTAYDIYPDYDVETYVESEFDVKGEFFHYGARGKFQFAKFIDKFNEPIKHDSKIFKVTFRNIYGKETDVTLDFNKATLISSDGKVWKPNSNNISTNEYSNILREFHRAIESKDNSRTSFQRSERNLDTIYRCYNQFPIDYEKNRIEKYKR